MRKRILTAVLALVMCLGLTVPAAAGATVTEIVSPDDYIEFLRNSHGGDYAAWMVGFSEGVCWHGSTWTGYGAFNADGKTIIPPHTYSEVKGFKNGYAWAKRNGAGWAVVDTNGRELFCLAELDRAGSDFSDGLFRVYLHGANAYGFVDTTGKMVVPSTYKNANSFHDGLAAVYDAASAYWGYIDKTGQVVIPYQYDSAGDFENGIARVYVSGRMTYIDKTGKEKVDWIPKAYPYISFVSSEVMIGQNSTSPTANWKYVFFNKSGQILSGPYTTYGAIDGICAVAVKENASTKLRWGFVNESGVEILAPSLRSVSALRDGYVMGETTPDNYSIFDKTGKVVGTYSGELAKDCNAGNGCFKIIDRSGSRHRYGFIDYTGKEIVAPKYKEVGDFSGGVAPVKNFEDKWGFVDTTGVEVVPCTLDSVLVHNEPGVFEVQNFNGDGRWSVVKASGWTAPAVPSTPAVPSIPSTPSTPSTPAKSVTASPTSAPVLVNGEKTAFDAYEINGNNYFKLRDLAYVLSGTGKQFEIAWDGAANAISLTSGAAYTAVGGEMTDKGAGKQNAVPTSSKILLDGKEVSFTAYEIGGNNYFKLRDVGETFDFGVDWDAAAGTIRIDTSKGYTN